jgi:hypothetical protein
MDDTYEVTADTMTVTKTVTEAIPASEFEARLDFWRDELQRIEDDYAARKADALAHIAELEPVLVDVKAVLEPVVLEPVKVVSK